MKMVNLGKSGQFGKLIQENQDFFCLAVLIFLDFLTIFELIIADVP